MLPGGSFRVFFGKYLGEHDLLIKERIALIDEAFQLKKILSAILKNLG